jgi:hypothetical protein
MRGMVERVGKKVKMVKFTSRKKLDQARLNTDVCVHATIDSTGSPKAQRCMHSATVAAESAVQHGTARSGLDCKFFQLRLL